MVAFVRARLCGNDQNFWDKIVSSIDCHIVVAGASGVIGAAAVEHFAAMPGWSVTALSRRRPIVASGRAFAHVAVDLEETDGCAAALDRLPPVTHVVYAAAREAPGLVRGWTDDTLIAANGRMFANLLDPLAARGGLCHVSLLQGAKAYGAHRHPVSVPLREDRPRDEHANFYWLQEDHLRKRAEQAGFDWTIWRPQVLLGGVAGAAMNPVAAIGAYAAICREQGRPFVYPGPGAGLMEMVDAALLAEAFGWAIDAPGASHQTFNVTNGDVMVLVDAWPGLAASLGLTDQGAPPVSLSAFFAEDTSIAAWARLAERHGLAVRDLPVLLGQSHCYLDLLLGPRISAKAVPVLLSTIKLRQAGFAACRDSAASLTHWLGRMTELNLLPPLFQRDFA